MAPNNTWSWKQILIPTGIFLAVAVGAYYGFQHMDYNKVEMPADLTAYKNDQANKPMVEAAKQQAIDTKINTLVKSLPAFLKNDKNNFENATKVCGASPFDTKDYCKKDFSALTKDKATVGAWVEKNKTEMQKDERIYREANLPKIFPTENDAALTELLENSNATTQSRWNGGYAAGAALTTAGASYLLIPNSEATPDTTTDKPKSKGWLSCFSCFGEDKDKKKKESKQNPAEPGTKKQKRKTKNGDSANNSDLKKKNDKKDNKNGDGKKKGKEGDEKKDNTMTIVIIVIIVAVVLIGGGVTAYCMCAGGPDDQLYDEELGHDGL